MAKWRYILKNGKALRDAINKDSNEETLEALRKCYEEIHEAMPDEYTEEDLYRDIDEIENQLDNCENYEDYDMTEDDVQDEVNYLLSNFYDLCDGLRIWVEL